MPIKILAKGKSLDKCIELAKKKKVKIIKSTVKSGTNRPKNNQFQALNSLIGDKKKNKISIKFKQGQVGIIQAEEAIIAKANELAHFKRLFNENLGNKVHLKAKIGNGFYYNKF